MWPAKFWEALYEPLIRRAAGLGRAAGAEDPDHYEKAFAHCDVLVIGGGPAGLMAALAAGRAGARVILADEDFRLGGRLLGERYEIDGEARRRMGRRRSRPSSLRCPTCGSCAAPRSPACSITGNTARSSASTIICAVPPDAPAAPALVEDRREARGAGGRRARALDRVRQQRPARRDAGGRRAHLYQPLRRGAGAAHRGLHQQ